MAFENLILEAIKEEIGKQMFDLWFSNKIHFELHDSRLDVVTPSKFLCQWIRKSFSQKINSALKKVAGKLYPTEYIVRTSEKDLSESSPKSTANMTIRQHLEQTALSQPNTEETSRPNEKLDYSTSDKKVKLKRPAEYTSSTPSNTNEPNASDLNSNTTDRPKSNLLSAVENGASAEVRTRRERKKDISKETPSPDLVNRNGYNISIGSPAPRNTGSFSRELASYDSFVVGQSNRTAKRAAEFAIEDPSKINPIFIYGPTSVGKTHLLEAICSEIRARDRKKQALFLTSGQFTTLFIESIQRERKDRDSDNKNFKNRFKNLSVLVVDDIHHLQDRKKTQMAFKETIDYLKAQKVQMVFSADTSLAGLKDFSKELISRLEDGLVCEIEAPERETLLQIFRAMTRQRGLSVPEDVCRFVISNFSNHARQISGVLNRLHAAQLATGAPIDMNMAHEVLSELMRGTRRAVSLQDIERAIVELFGVSAASLRSKSRAKVTCYPRMLAMWLARKYTNAALSEIGIYFGNRSHSTVLSAQKRVDLWLDENAPFEQLNKTWYIADTLSRLENAIAR